MVPDLQLPFLTKIPVHIKDLIFNQVLYTSGPVSLKERLLYTFYKLFVKQVKSFLLLLDLDPFILLSSPHNIKVHQVHKSIRYFHISCTDSL